MRWEKGEKGSLSLPHLEAGRVGSAQLLEVKVKWVQGRREREGTRKGGSWLWPHPRGGR